VRDQVQQLCDFGLKGMGLLAHINNREVREMKGNKTKTPLSWGRLAGIQEGFIW
jgi:hypothetical protein